jgi:hypothetical protein
MKAFLFFVFFHSLMLFGQDNETGYKYTSYPDRTIVFFKTGEIEINTIDFETGKTFTTKGFYRENIDSVFGYCQINETGEVYLVLKNEVICCLIDNNNRIYLRAVNGLASRGELIYNKPSYINASSFLSEGNVNYVPENMNSSSGLPWVEGVNGHGINEKILIKKNMLTTIYVSIGFVSFHMPELYKENSRPRKIKITAGNSFSFYFDLKDTPNYQTIKLPKPLSKDDVLTIEIVDVYSGSKYTDTCINAILYDIID